LETALPEHDAFVTFNQLSPARSIMVTDAFERNWLTRGRDLYVVWELNDEFQLRGQSVPTTGDAAYARMRSMGIDWALVGGPDRVTGASTWLAAALRSHGQPRFSSQGWDLYQFVDHPTAPTPIAACDSAAGPVPSCWVGRRGPTGAATGVLTRTVPVCPGQELALTVTERAGGPSVPVAIVFPGAAARVAGMPGQTAPGSAQPTYATVPTGAHQAILTISGAPSAQITRATAGRFGPACTP
jgi:hypothetical protein